METTTTTPNARVENDVLIVTDPTKFSGGAIHTLITLALFPETKELPAGVSYRLSERRYQFEKNLPFLTVKGTYTARDNRGQGKRFMLRHHHDGNFVTYRLSLATVRDYINALAEEETKLHIQAVAYAERENARREKTATLSEELKKLHGDFSGSIWPGWTHADGSVTYRLDFRDLTEEQVRAAVQAVTINAPTTKDEEEK